VTLRQRGGDARFVRLAAQIEDVRKEEAVAPQAPSRNDRNDTDLDALLAKLRDNDRSAWHTVMQRYGRLLVHTARRVGLNHSDAADVAQLTWLRLFEHAHQIREPARLPAWLTATARRESLRVAMAAKKYVLCADPTVTHGPDAGAGRPDVYPTDGEYDPRLERAMARLPHPYRVLLRLLMSDAGPSYTEIARTLGLPIGSIGPMRMRALDMLRRSPEFADAVARRVTGSPAARTAAPRALAAA
jgi:RNA polymerase sigma factor (sigma-70 family)